MQIRSFIAIEIPDSIQLAIVRLTTKLRNHYPYPVIRWVNPANIHLTLKFLGNISISDLEKIARTIALDASLIAPFSITFSDFGIFPNARKPRIVWISTNSPPILKEIQSRIEVISSEYGIQKEIRPFSPHITLGRIGNYGTVQDFEHLSAELSSINPSVIDKISISAIKIFKSDLKPTGPIYTPIHNIPLGNSNN